ncbi:MAG: tRNA-dihydrouridine synthase family protein [Akkermansia sp.]|nr:tRNA-dihydrouridine synthase family protein [Akkermansia sp.]
MQDVTDLAFMRTLARIGSLPDLFVTAYFRSTPTTCAIAEANLRCIQENETGVPILAQLVGSESAPLMRDAERLLQLPVAGINLNAGCPSPLVNRHGAGAELLRNLTALQDCLQGLRRVVPEGMFSVKCRTGWADAAEFPAILSEISAASPDMVMVHGRTRKALYTANSVNTEPVRMAVKHLNCPVLGNGDICTVAQAHEWMRTTTPAGVMIGRGAVRNPYIFRCLRGGAPPSADEMRFYFHVLIEETNRILHTKRTPAGHCNRMKKYLAFCYEDFTPEQEHTLRRCTNISDMQRILSEASAPLT